MVLEAQATRAELVAARRFSITPHLTLGVSVIAPTHGVLALRNLGPGAATDLKLTIEYQALNEMKEWAWPTLAPGARQEFILPQGMGHLDDAVAQDLVVRV